MALRVTARLAQRLGTRAPTQTTRTPKRALGSEDPGPMGGIGRRPDVADCAARGEGVSASSGMRCNAKCGVRETVMPAMTASNCARVFSRCTSGAPHGPASNEPALDRQALPPFGAACIDDGAAAPGLHADQEAVGACAAHFGGLVGAFHVRISGKPMIIVEFPNSGNNIAARRSLRWMPDQACPVFAEGSGMTVGRLHDGRQRPAKSSNRCVDKALIN